MVSEKEVKIASNTAMSGLDLPITARALAFPHPLTGRRILNVGAGFSDVTASLLKQGANAYALDPKYANEQTYRAAAQANILDSMLLDAARVPLKRRVMKNFLHSIHRNPKRYIPGYATEIPFDNDFFDLVFSTSTVFPYLSGDYELLQTVAEECIRVTKRRGSVQFHPYDGNGSADGESVDPAVAANQRRLFEYLSTRPGVTCRIERGANVLPRLYIRKD